VPHDAEREWAYDRGFHVSGLDTRGDEAQVQQWTIVDMKAEWKRLCKGISGRRVAP